MKWRTNFILGVGGLLVLVLIYRIGVWGYHRIDTLNIKVDRLTGQLEEASRMLEAEVERSERVEALVIRMEKSDASRATALRGVERTLTELKEQSVDVQLVLDTIVPDESLHGLSSWQNIPATSGP